jgi:glycosyltransferase involved in cell wall biosynthesis
MRVALDATPLTLSSGGLRRYTEELSRALAAEFSQDVYTLIADRVFSLSGPAFPTQALPNLRMGELPRTFLEKRWWSIGAALALRRMGADVFHGTNFETPYLKLRPAVMTLHDLSPWKDRKWHTGAARVRRRMPWLLRWGSATMVITPTEAVRREAIERFGLPGDRVVAIAHGPSRFIGGQPRRVAGRPYFLFVGTVEPRKNVEMLVEAWSELSQEADLVIAGRRRADGPVIRQRPGLRVLGEVADDDLGELYSGALAMVYPSHYEGFGLPVLEAMQRGAAVVISGDAALQEVAGGAALRADSARELGEIMRALLADPGLVEHYREVGLRRAKEFSWEKSARMTHEVYGEAIARRKESYLA